MRIEPPLSVACVAGKIPLATAAAAPPLEPPALCSVFQGLRVGPLNAGSVDTFMPNSGALVRPAITKPALRRRVTSSASKSNTLSAKKRLPWVSGMPLTGACRSLMKYGTPANGPSAPVTGAFA